MKAMGTTSVPAKAPASSVQALLGGLAAGVIALILYKFTTTIEAALSRQTLSDNFSVCPPLFRFSAKLCPFQFDNGNQGT